MLEANSPTSSTDPSVPSNTGTPAVAVSQTPAQTTQPHPAPAPGDPATPAPIAASPAPKPTRPEGVPESFWDKDRGELKTSDWASSYEELRAFKATEDAKRATVPAQADLYKPELPKDLKLPVEMGEVNPQDPLYIKWRDYAFKHGMSQETFAEGVGLWAAAEADKRAALNQAIKARDESLGPNGPQRVDALNKHFIATFGDEVGKQFSQTLFTRDIIAGFEKVFEALSRQGVTKFSSLGRETIEGRSDGRPDNWDSMSALDRRMWNLKNAGRNAA